MSKLNINSIIKKWEIKKEQEKEQEKIRIEETKKRIAKQHEQYEKDYLEWVDEILNKENEEIKEKFC